MPRYLIWLNWPESAFRLNAKSFATFRNLFPGEAKAVKTECAFLRALPRATHAIVWEFHKEWFSLAPRLRVLATPGAGRELLPKDDELPRGVVRVNGAFHGAIMAETVVAFIFSHARALLVAHDWQREGKLWPRAELSPFCFRVSGTRAVILGYGHVGRAIGAKLETLGVDVVGFGRGNFSGFRAALKSADWLIAALPSDTGTDNLVDAAVLRALPRRAVFVNVGRGNCVDEYALAAALRSGRLAAAYLDVFNGEPLSASSPLAGEVPNLHRHPHASAFTPEYLPLFFRELAANPIFCHAV